MELIDILIIICYTIVCFSSYLTGYLFLKKSLDKPKNVKIYLLGLGLFFILYGIAKTVVFIYELTFPENFVWQLSKTDFEEIFAENPEIKLQHDIFWKISTGIANAGLVILMFELEKTVLEKKTRYIFTILIILTTIPSLIFGVEQKDVVDIIRIILYAGNVIIIVIPLSYLYLAVKTSGDSRKRALGAMCGMLIFFLGIIINGSIGKSLFESGWGITGIYMTYMFFALFIVIGASIYLKSFKY